MSNKLPIAFGFSVFITILTFIYGLGRGEAVFLRGLPVPYIIDGSLFGLNFVIDVIVWMIVSLLIIRLISELGRNIKNFILIYGLILFSILIFAMSYLISHQYQILIKPTL